MISKKSLVAVLDKSIILTITAPNDNANQDPVQCEGGANLAPPRYLSPEASEELVLNMTIVTIFLRIILRYITFL